MLTSSAACPAAVRQTGSSTPGGESAADDDDERAAVSSRGWEGGTGKTPPCTLVPGQGDRLRLQQRSWSG